jgi:hypothetical protein
MPGRGIRSLAGDMKDIRVVMVEARPRPDSEEYGQVAGAFVNIYSTAASDAEALEIARSAIAEAGWSIQSVEDQYVLGQAEAQELPDILPYYEQALIDGVVLVFNIYRHDGEVPDVVH